jgi:aminoglycoside phosphotransferase (APT) family kinase protein
MTETNPEGYQVEAVENWVRKNVPALKPPFRWTRLVGGHSNLTYQIEDTAGKMTVIRRPPQGQLLPKAHDMSREWSCISALGNTAVPVPEAIAFCEDPDITGAWFYIMGHVDGHPLHTAEDTLRILPNEKTRLTTANSFIDVLAALHSLDPDEIGLGELGKKEGYVARQLKTWYRSWTSSVEPAQFDDPRAHELQEYLLNHLPEQGMARVVHGDYGIHNTLIGPDGKIAAVVDWEISTLGDPLADLAYALNVWPEADDPIPPKPESPTALPGFPKRSYFADRYAATTGRDLSKIDYYLAFNRWKGAAINHGLYARYMEGQKSTEGIDLDEKRLVITRSLDLAEEAINRLS